MSLDPVCSECVPLFIDDHRKSAKISKSTGIPFWNELKSAGLSTGEMIEIISDKIVFFQNAHPDSEKDVLQALGEFLAAKHTGEIELPGNIRTQVCCLFDVVV